jgi:hypothetical protein
MGRMKKPELLHYFDIFDLKEWAEEHHPEVLWMFEDDNYFSGANGHLGGLYFADLIADMRRGEYAGRSIEAIERFRDDLGAGDTVRVHVWW